jgi:uncharacterized protein (TIGR00725 family)
MAPPDAGQAGVGTLPAVRPVIAVFGSSTTPPGDPWWDAGVRCGRLLAEAGYDVATGGYGGLMEAASQGARAGGAGRVIGVTAPPCFPMRSGVNPYVTQEIPASSMTERIHTIVGLAAGFVVLDGSIGTLTELLVAWNVAYVDRLSQPTSKPIVTVGERWAEVVPYLTHRAATNGDLVKVAADVDEAVAVLLRLLDA